MSEANVNHNFEVTNNMRENEPRDWYPKSAAQELVRKFHAAFGAPVGDSPRSIGAERGFLRKDMLQEELNEFADAVDADDIVEQFDALIDILVLAYGGLVEMGIDAGPGKVEVMRANMSKLDENGLPIISRGMELDGFPEGKILKGPNYVAPDLFKVLTEQGWVPTYQEYLDYYKLKDPTEILAVLAGKPAPPRKEDDLKGPHEFVKVLSSNNCVCGKIKPDMIHHISNPEDFEEWDIDNNAPARKDNFRDRVMNGWTPSIQEQISYEAHRQKIEHIYPDARVNGDGKIEVVIYRNGEKDIDWDFEAKAPRVKVGNTRRKDNFRDAVMNGWKPDTASQIRYERHRRELDERYPTVGYDVTGEFVVNVYSYGEKDIDWDFEAKAPRVKVEGPNE